MQIWAGWTPEMDCAAEAEDAEEGGVTNGTGGSAGQRQYEIMEVNSLCLGFIVLWQLVQYAARHVHR